MSRKNLALAVIVGAGTVLACAAHALTLSPAHLEAAQRLGCVLADDALGALSEDQFNQRFDSAVEGFSEGAVDIIYAKALGTIDGLLFGATSQGGEASRRLREFRRSQRCSAETEAARTVAL
jgi:hypothetical protein